MEYQPALPMVYQTLSYGIMNSSLLVEMRGGGGGGGVTIYHEGVQNTMTKNWPQGQNTIWKIEPRVKISYVNWPRGQFTMGFKIPYDTGTQTHDLHIRGQHANLYATDAVKLYM